MREVLGRAGQGDEKAQLALDVYVHRLRAGIAAMSAALKGLDVLAFTGGVGQHSPQIRSLAAAGLGFLGVAIDEQRNAASGHGPDVSASAAGTRTLVVPAREDLEIARQARELLTPR